MRIIRTTLLLAISMAVWASSADAQRTRTPRPPTVTTERVDSQTQTRQMNIAQELRCRGGDLQFNVTPGRTDSATGEQMMNVVMSFRHGASPAGAQNEGLSSGHCSWIDRAMDGNEPWRLMWEDVDSAQAKALLNGGLSQPDRSPTAAERWPDAHSIPRYLSTPDHYWTFWVRANGDHFDVERNGYWKRSNLDRIPNQTTPMNAPSGNLQLPTMSRQDRVDRGTSTKDFVYIGTVSGEVRWRQDYGLPDSNGSGTPDPLPCRTFRYKAERADGSYVGTVTGEYPSIQNMRVENGYYICRYSYEHLPLNEEISILPDIEGGGVFDPSKVSQAIDHARAPWVYGSQAQPPQGFQRVLTGIRTVTLTRERPNVTLNFEMVYAVTQPAPRAGVQDRDSRSRTAGVGSRLGPNL